MAENNSLVRQSTTSLENTRRRILYALLKKKYENKEIDENFIQQEIEYYLQDANKGVPILSPKKLGDLIDVEAINDEFQEYEIDIHSLYQQLEHVGEQIKQHQKLNESVLKDVRVRMIDADKKLEAFRQSIVEHNVNQIYYETFLDRTHVESVSKYYTNKDGYEMPPDLHLEIDQSVNGIRLPLVNQENTLVNFAGVKLADIKVHTQIGGGFIRTKNPKHDISHAIDTSMETMWSESILVDEPLEVNMGLPYYNYDFGALCEVEIEYDSMTKVNEIAFTPFTEYPMEIVSVWAYTDNNGEEDFELISPQSYMLSNESADTISYQFQDVICKKLRITFNQRHYIKRDLIMERKNKSLTDAWLKAQGHLELDSSLIFKPVYQDLFEDSPHWTYLNDFLKNHSIIEEITKTKKKIEPDKVQLSKYEYQYGMYNIASNYNEYHYEGVYVSKPLGEGNIHRVELITNEEHPILPELNIPITNIEYYVTDKKDPSKEDWFSILPANTENIKAERLFFTWKDGFYKARTRFNLELIDGVYCNGKRLLFLHDYEVKDNLITVYDYKPSMMYTIDYKPLENAYRVDFLEAHKKDGKIIPQQSIEDFDHFYQNREIELEYYPFVDKEVLNNLPISWQPSYLSNDYIPMKIQIFLPDGEQISQPINPHDTHLSVENKTDYFNPDHNLLEPFRGDNYQYRVVGERVIFNTTFEKGTRINVEYPFLTGPIRLKAIMRRNLHNVVGLTPFLKDYKVTFQSLK